MGKITITEELLGAIKKRLAQDNRNAGIDKGVWNVRLHRALETFVSEELQSLDSKLADYYEYDIGEFFHQKTIDRAVKTDMKASRELFNALGYYAYGSGWSEKNVAPPLEEVVAVAVEEKEIEEEEKEIEEASQTVSPITQNKKTLKWVFLAVGGLLVFFLFGKSCNSNETPSSVGEGDSEEIIEPGETDDCDCLIGRLGENVMESDSSGKRTAIELKDWEGLEKVRELARSKYGKTNPMLLHEEVDMVLSEITSDFSESEDYILSQHLIHSFHCAVDKLYCTDEELPNEEKLQHRQDNLKKYWESIKSIVPIKREKTRSMQTMPPKQIPAPIQSFQIKGIPIGETAVKQISDKTGLKHSNINKESISVEIKLKQEAIALPNKPERYFQPASQLSISVNGHKCCCGKGELEIQKIGNKLTGNPEHQIRGKVEEQIQNLVKEKNAFIIQKISSCLNSK